MRVRLQSSGRDCVVTPFVGGFVANVCHAVVASLKAPRPSRSVSFVLEGEAASVEIDGIPIPLDARQGFAGIMVRDTLRGMVSHLKGIDPGGALRIELLAPDPDGQTVLE